MKVSRKWDKRYTLKLNKESELVIYKKEKHIYLELKSQITDTVHSSFLIDRYHNAQSAKINAQRYIERMTRNIL